MHLPARNWYANPSVARPEAGAQHPAVRTNSRRKPPSETSEGDIAGARAMKKLSGVA